METIQVEKKKAIIAYHKGDGNVKAVLKELLGCEFNDDPKTYIKTFADVCSEMGCEANDFLVEACSTIKEKADMCWARLLLIERLFNQGKEIDLLDVNVYKYYAVHRIVPDSTRPFGFRLAFYDFDDAYFNANLGARPLSHDAATAKYIGEQFIEEFEQHFHYLNLLRKQS